MLNGKFFTGLPPKMIERGGGGGAAPNRLESHFFWPDDSKVDSAVETRLKRRNSVQLQENDKPTYGKQFSVGVNEVDTRKRFTKEFSQSSIQFYDNLNDNDATDNRRTTLLRSRGSRRSEITEKPTATKLQLPETIVDEAYTSAKKKQAYMSKIEFYDYVNEDDTASSSRNNLRKPKMDMNDKREMELNTKNSPKLQIKRDVRSLSEEKEVPKINNRDVKTLERPRPVKELNVYRAPSKKNDELRYREEIESRSNSSPQRRNTHYGNEQYEDENDHYFEERRIQDRRFERDRYSKSNYSVLRKSRSNYEREPEVLEDDYYSHQRYEDIPEESQYHRVQNATSQRSNIRSEYRPRPEPEEFHNNCEEDIDERMKKVRIQSSPPPRKYQYDHDDRNYDDDEESRASYERPRPIPSRERHPHGNTRAHGEYRKSEDYEYTQDRGVMNNNYRGTGSRNKTPINRVANKLNNEVHRTRDASPTLASPSTKSRSPSNPSRNAATTASTAVVTNEINKPRKHLRSSLCFHDGAIIAENDAAQSPTTTSGKPTAAPRRNIRSTATKRVSVGLPD
ncbi:uncharacterized protein LOC142221713 [Haematobia irritans]|uniref:uncharacterized protein LOC142221713 n=1 Tax=Haematobia irritans TaxID=7368 RepID=UPI003F5078EB